MEFGWILMYGIVHSLAEETENIWIVCVAILCYVLLLLEWIRKTGRSEAVGIMLPCNYSPKVFVREILLLILPIVNLLMTTGLCWQWSCFWLMLGTCLAEEMFFRGFLLARLLPLGRNKACILSSLVFAFLHVSNYLAGQPIEMTVLQIMLSFSAGLCLSRLSLLHFSIFPGFVLHFLINLSACIAASREIGLIFILGLVVSILVYLVFGFWVYK